MATPKPQTQRSRLTAAAHVLALLRRAELSPSKVAVVESLSVVKGLFNRIWREDQWDWFTVRGQLGYPSSDLSKYIGVEITGLRSSILADDERSTYERRMILFRMSTERCLSVFLGSMVLMDEPEAGWIYTLSTRETPDLLKIGMTKRSVEERVREINGSTGVAIPYGVRGCWRVKSPALAEKIVHLQMDNYRLRRDREFFRTDFRVACKMIQSSLSAESLELRTLRNLAALAPS